MSATIGYDRLKGAWLILWHTWPLLAAWYAWTLADRLWAGVMKEYPGGLFVPVPIFSFVIPQSAFAAVQPTVALLGPLAIMALAVMLGRSKPRPRTLALTGVVGLLAATLLTAWPVAVRLWPYVGLPQYPVFSIARMVHPAFWVAMVVGIMATFTGWCLATRVPRLGELGASAQPQRAASDNHGHADWLDMPGARKRFPGPNPAYGGLVVGEAYRVDLDRAVHGAAFDPAERKTWGMGGKPPLLIDPCLGAATHALVFAGAGGFKTTSTAIPTLLTWTASALVLDPSREIGPMMRRYREGELGHQVVTLDPFDANTAAFNVLDWIDITTPAAETHVSTVVRWLCGETREEAGSSKFFGGRGRNLIRCLLADMLWDPALPPDQKTLHILRERIVTPEDEMRELLQDIYDQSHSRMARQIAGTIKGAVKETFSGIYQNADEDTSWLSTAAFADLVSGSSFKTTDLAGGKLTVFLQIPLAVLQDTPALGRVVIGAMLNAVYEADGKVQGRVLFLLDEVARLGFMGIIETARDAGRKYGITMMLLYQSLGQLIRQWGPEGKRSWYDSSAWRLFATVQDPDTAREVSAMCGEYGVVTTSSGDTEGNQSRGGTGNSSSRGRSENRSETKRALIKPEELIQDTRSDEAIVIMGRSKPLRCGRAIFFRRREWEGNVDDNRFHKKP